MVALTYDDGPSIYTPRVLKTLKENNSVATFFVVGNRVPTYSDTVKKAHDMGCEIGNHTYEHKCLTRISETEVRRQISRTNTKGDRTNTGDHASDRWSNQSERKAVGGNAVDHLVDRYA